MDPQPEGPARSISVLAYLRLLRENRNFRRLWLAQIISEVGDWFYTLAIYSLLLQLTGRAGSVALALVLQVLPQTLVGPAAGIVNDRISRKKVMITADLLRTVIVFAMLLVRSRSMVWLVYPLLLLETIMAAFFEPARNAVIPSVTAREDVLVANTLSSATWSVNLLIGASAGGVVMALLGRDAVFVLNALSFLFSAFLIKGMHFNEPHADASHPLGVSDLFDFSPIFDGIRYVREHPRLRTVVFVKAGELMIGPSWVLFTVMGLRYFPVHLRGIDPERGAVLGMSLLLGARGAGAVIGPLIAARWASDSEDRLSLGISRLSRGGGRLWIVGLRSQRLARLPLRDDWALWRFHGVGIFYHSSAAEHRRSISRPGVCGGSGFFYVYHRRWRVCVRYFSGLRPFGAHYRQYDWTPDAGACRAMVPLYPPPQCLERDQERETGMT